MARGGKVSRSSNRGAYYRAGTKVIAAGNKYLAKQVAKSFSDYFTAKKPARSPLVNPVGNVAKRLFARATPGGSSAAARRIGGAANSRSGGRFRTRKYRPRKAVKKAFSGINFTREVGWEETSTTQSVLVGHSTLPLQDCWNKVWQLIMKHLMNKTGISIRNFASVAEDMTAGDDLTLVYRTNDATSVANFSISFVAGQTWNALCGLFGAHLPIRASNVTLLYMAYTPTVNTVGSGQDRAPARLDLEGFYLDFDLKSTMKVQNRTINSTGNNETIDVDNVPLYGKIYSGKGNGVDQQPLSTDGTPVLQLVANIQTGAIRGTSVDNLPEPIEPLYFRGSSKYGKAHLDPGVVKTSTLVYKNRMHLNRFRELFGRVSDAFKSRHSFGKYTFFHLERMIQTLASPPGLIVACEINHKMYLSGYTRYNNMTVPQFETTFL